MSMRIEAMMLPDGWRSAVINDLAQIKGGKRLPKGEKFADTVTPFPYIRVTDFVGFGVNLTGLKYLRPETHEAIKRYTINKGDVYISIAVSIGITGRIPAELNGANLTENAAKLVINCDIMDTCYFMYYLASEAAQKGNRYEIR